MQSSFTRLLRSAPIAAATLTAEASCPACAKPIDDSDSTVEIHRALYHSRCALYNARRRRRAD